ncbi:hypothetical protein [Streptomyces sp. BP-8]|uniref:SH3 domain-containing protein n=1 Tax=Streptomyces sirii TaxID=3127701 RepID=A0ABZ2QNY4_9ACTN
MTQKFKKRIGIAVAAAALASATAASGIASANAPSLATARHGQVGKQETIHGKVLEELKMRKMPDKSFPVVGLLGKGAHVYVDDRSTGGWYTACGHRDNRWYHANNGWDNTWGWVAATCVKFNY